MAVAKAAPFVDKIVLVKGGKVVAEDIIVSDGNHGGGAKSFLKEAIVKYPEHFKDKDEECFVYSFHMNLLG